MCQHFGIFCATKGGLCFVPVQQKCVLLTSCFAGYSSDPAWFSEPNMHALIWRPAYG